MYSGDKSGGNTLQTSDNRNDRAYHHGDLKQSLLDETARILREEGLDALSLRRLATQLGVSRTAPYNHYANKESLLCAVAEEGFRRFRLAMEHVEQGKQFKDGQSMMRAYAFAYVSFARENQEYYDLMYGRSSWQSEKHGNSLSETARTTLRDFVQRLRRYQEQRQVRSDVDVAEFAQLYWGTLHGISRLLLDGVYSKSLSIKQRCNGAADMLWQQLNPQ